MNEKRYCVKAAILLVITLVWGLCMPVFAGSASNDNSLSSLGILTEGAEVSPEFEYGRTEYDVTVPAGTQKLELDPVPSHGAAWIADISGTELTNGEATVTITVSAENGEQYPYHLHVKAEGGAVAPVETEPQTETEKETETEPQTEDPRYVKVDRTAMEEAEKTITALKTEVGSYRDRSGILMKILYGMIAFCVILLFVVINLILKKKDLKTELNEYRGFGYPQGSASDYTAGQNYEAEEYFDEKPAKRQKKDKSSSKRRRKKGGEEMEQNQESMTAASGYDQESMQDQMWYDEEDAGSQEWYGQNDDPTTVPKPSKAKKKAKKMPEYQQQPEYTYRQPAGKKQADKDVEVTMIDL